MCGYNSSNVISNQLYKQIYSYITKAERILLYKSTDFGLFKNIYNLMFSVHLYPIPCWIFSLNKLFH